MAQRIFLAVVFLIVLLISVNTNGLANTTGGGTGETAVATMDDPPQFPPPPPWP